LKLGIILTTGNRSKAYLQKIIKKGIKLDQIFFMNNNNQEKQFSKEAIIQSKKNGFDISKSVENTLLDHKLEFVEFSFNDINNSELIDAVKKSTMDYFVFAGGGILKQEILSSKSKFIHFHPGIVPEYKGSTCFYYSLINENNCGVTAFVMNEGIDTGDIIYQKKFQKPDHIFIDDVFDSHIRSETLIDVLENKLLLPNKFKKQDSETGNTYFIIHPVLKHIAILNCIKDI